MLFARSYGRAEDIHRSMLARGFLGRSAAEDSGHARCSFARALCDRAVFSQGGVIAAEGPVEDIVTCFGWELAPERNKLAR